MDISLSLRCRGCGKKALLPLSGGLGRLPAKCYLAFESDGRPVRGCGYDSADRVLKNLIERFLAERAQHASIGIRPD